MKYLLMIFVFISCTENTKQKPEPDKPINQWLLVDSAKQIARQIILNVEKADKKQISKKEFERRTDPLKTTLDSLRKNLKQWAVVELDEYRAKVLDSLLDRKVKRDKL